MRRANKEITDITEILELLDGADVLRVAMSLNDQPYLVPFCFGREGNRLYMHCATEGLKLDIIRENPRVCFEVEADVEIIDTGNPCDWTMTYRSVIGFGKAVLVEGEDEKQRGLDAMMAHYGAKGPYEYPEAAIEKTAVLRIDIERMTGKRRTE
jgi:nitroimidazol reductase NimA-like FMN-containing flavoprotein (pyridoxamine 5'-phosphate oxidase superfamily)